MSERVECVKQSLMCVVERKDEKIFFGTNTCVTDGDGECRRVKAGCKTGEGYELCESIHSEINCVNAIKAYGGPVVEGVAYLYGHNWFCGPCQWALQEVGVNVFIVTGEEKPEYIQIPVEKVGRPNE